MSNPDLIFLPEARSIMAERGTTVTLRTYQRWAKSGRFGSAWGKRDKRWLMRRHLILRLLHFGGPITTRTRIPEKRLRHDRG